MTEHPKTGTVYLVGVKNTGKSHLARRLAVNMNLETLDTDERVADLYFRETGTRLSVREIFAIDRGDTFRRLEALACRQAGHRGVTTVVATGGGICDNAAAVAELRPGLVVALEGEPEFLFRRIIRHGIPSFMTATTRPEAWSEFRSLHERRQALYRALADFVVDVTYRDEVEIAAEIEIRIEEYLHGGK